MKIYTLGTSHGNSTYCRYNSSTLYETNDGSLYLIDAGAPVESLIRRKGLEINKLRAVFITHLHDDHAGGLTGLIKQVIKYPNGRIKPLKIFLPEKDVDKVLRQWLNCLHIYNIEEYIQFFVTEESEIYTDENITISAAHTAHLKTDDLSVSFGYIISEKQSGKRILHTGDLNWDFKDFPKIAKDIHFDLCLCEATHYKPEYALPLLKKANIDRLIFIHIGDEWHIYQYNSDWVVKNGEKELLSYYSEIEYPICIAHDGDEFYL